MEDSLEKRVDAERRAGERVIGRSLQFAQWAKVAPVVTAGGAQGRRGSSRARRRSPVDFENKSSL
jgi:hypothetical protein